MGQIRRVLVAAAGIAVVALGLLTPAGPEAEALCVHAATDVLFVETTIRVGACPTVPPADPDNPCPGGQGHYRKINLVVEVEILVCV